MLFGEFSLPPGRTATTPDRLGKLRTWSVLGDDGSLWWAAGSLSSKWNEKYSEGPRKLHMIDALITSASRCFVHLVQGLNLRPLLAGDPCWLSGTGLAATGSARPACCFVHRDGAHPKQIRRCSPLSVVVEVMTGEENGRHPRMADPPHRSSGSCRERKDGRGPRDTDASAYSRSENPWWQCPLLAVARLVYARGDTARDGDDD
jgi:hypothetical protein